MLRLLLLSLLATACTATGERRTAGAEGGALDVATAERGSIRVMGTDTLADTLSDSATVTRVIPEPDGEAVAFIFTAPARRVTAGLALIDRARARAQLVWPDSVSSAWWSGPHRLAFQSATGDRGVRAVVDVHASVLQPVDAAQDTAPRATPSAGAAIAAAEVRATAYIDSLRVQPDGVPQSGSLRYTVTRIVPAPSDSLAAFYVIARGPAGGERLNPAWYALDLRSNRIAPIDSITGPARALPGGAGAWADSARFVYAKGPALIEARVTRRRD
jgi:hypothetical protein